jgi:hypothetical protein
LAVLAAACGEPRGEGPPADPAATSTTSLPEASTTTASPPGEADRAAVLAAALHRLVAADNTFGPEHRFSELLVQAFLDPAAGTGAAHQGRGRALTDAERQAIEEALAPLAPIRWIDDPAGWRTEDLRPAVVGAAILGVGEPVFDAAGALVPASLWCGGVCGIWLTYRLERRAGQWVVLGPEGPFMIS